MQFQFSNVPYSIKRLKQHSKLAFISINIQQRIDVMIIGVYWVGLSFAQVSVMVPLIHYHI